MSSLMCCSALNTSSNRTMTHWWNLKSKPETHFEPPILDQFNYNIIYKNMSNQKTKSEKREKLSQKKKIKEKKGGTLAGQFLKTKTSQNYLKEKKK